MLGSLTHSQRETCVIACVQKPRLDLYARIYYLSNTNAKLVIDNAIADSRRACLLDNHNVYVFNTNIRLNSTGVAERLPYNARNRKVTGSSLNREVCFQLLEYWSRPWIEWQGMAFEFRVYFPKTRELKVDFLHVCVNLMNCSSSVRTVLLLLYH